MVVGAEGNLIDGRFELLERLGGGGMGLVWRARDVLLERDVALKEVRPPDPELLRLRPDAADMLRARVLREAVSLAQLSHPNVVTIHHIVSSEEVAHPWLVMELVPGGSLQDRLDRGTCTPTETAELGRGVLRALRAAHEAGILHRDVKPGNVLLRADGTPVLTDFGIAAVREATNLTNTGELVGSPDYMAPERLRGRDDDPSSDLWSLAMMLYVAVEGHHPMHRGSTLATLAAILEEDVPEPRRAGALTPVLRSVLVKDVTARPDAEMLDLLLAEATGERVRTVPGGPVVRPAGAGAVEAPAGEPGTGTVGLGTSRRRDAEAPAAGGGTEPGAGGAGSGGESGGAESGVGPGGGETRGGASTGKTTGGAASGGADGGGTDGDGDDRGGAAVAASTVLPRPAGPRSRRWRVVPSTLAVLVIAVAGWTVLPDLLDDDKSPGATGNGPGASTPSTTPSPSTSSSPSEEPKKENLQTPAGARRVVRAMDEAMGTTKAITCTLYRDYADIYAVSADGEVYDAFDYREGKGVKGQSVGLMNGRASFDVADVNWDALPRLIKVAETELELRPPAKVSHISVDVDSDGPYLSVYATGEVGSAMLRANLDGKITSRSMAS
ncbi:serine/threonine-protein kinase [Streptomyces sp. CMB-StM0423]|uniref:serine/threonine-protein kinase n=1 Tax=Streptomyces sp. CMB-StM0423 TaxID=2059884 RepID=UPI000C6FED39|nr:serine/threonine-protein kinase [Streptomyces sp. CMB-StM0423]AUH41368.1 serine/threonine protein kinase [Streptomyces sp. CMB-StM0423]